MPYDISRSFRLDADDERRLQGIMSATTLSQAEALRFSLEVAEYLFQYATADDPKAVFLQFENGQGRIKFLERMSIDELEEAMQYVRYRVGASRFDKLLKRGSEMREKYMKDDEGFRKARDTLLASSEPPYTLDQIASAIQRIGGCSKPYAKIIFDRQWNKSDQLRQTAPGKYAFINTETADD